MRKTLEIMNDFIDLKSTGVLFVYIENQAKVKTQ